MKKIKLQYTIDENELAPETARILGKSISRLTSIVATVPEMGSMLTVNTINEISGLRQELANIDVMLDDVHAIIDGYVQYQQEQHQLRHSATPEQLASQQGPDLSDFDLSDLSAEQAVSLMNKINSLDPENRSEINDPDLKSVMPELKTQKELLSEKWAAGQNSESPEPEIDIEKIKNVSEEIQQLTSHQDPARMTPEYARQMLSQVNEIDFTDIETLGTKLENLKHRLQENEITD